jgi:hypothetical protein
MQIYVSGGPGRMVHPVGAVDVQNVSYAFWNGMRYFECGGFHHTILCLLLAGF